MMNEELGFGGEAKSAIRQRMRRQRNGVSGIERQKVSLAICDKVLARLDVQAVLARRGVVCVYAATSVEINVWKIVHTFCESGGKVVLPRWNGKNYELAFWDEQTQLVAGPMNILEPLAQATICNVENVDIWIVPGLAFTVKGDRLGYGGGWYDRFLKLRSPNSIALGVAYNFQLVETLPVENNDQRVDEVVIGE